MIHKKTIPIILIGIGLLLMMSGLLRTHHLNNKEEEINSTLNTRKQLLQKYKLEAENPLVTIKHPTTPAQQKTHDQLEVNNGFFKTTSAFFNIVFNFNSQQQWEKRKVKASSYATADILQNKMIFNSGKDLTGHSIIAANKVISTLNSVKLFVSPIDDQSHTVSGLAQVTYSGSVNNSNSVSHTDVYFVKYDYQQHKLTDVQRIGELNDERE